MDLAIRPDITLEARRCDDCGRWWALEKYASGRCPLCADRAIDRANKRADRAERQVRGLRGAMKTKTRRRT